MTACGLAVQLSRISPCRLDGDATFGCTASEVWVRNGCRGIFVCGGRQVPCGHQYQSITERRCPCGNLSASEASDATTKLRPPQIELVHIPKTGGSSLRLSLNEQLGADLQHWGQGGLGPKASKGDENCMRDTNPTHFRITLLRRPRNHVFSQYLECRSGWFVNAKPSETIGTFPRGGTIAADFGSWIHAFATDPHHHGFGCYSPLNMQARAMTCCRGSRCGNHNVHLVASEPTPNLEEALGAAGELSVVGLTERYRETLCLITYRLGRVVPPSCFCGPPRRSSDGAASAGAHTKAAVARVPRERQRTSAKLSVEMMPPELAPLIDNLTAVDRSLYAAVAARFANDMASMERELGRGRMLCDAEGGA